jgi:Ca2+-binding RTX toxin-like protein
MPRATLRRVSLTVIALICAGAPAVQAAPGGDAFVEETTVSVPGMESASAAAACPDGSRVVGGGVDAIAGFLSLDRFPDYVVQMSGPVDDTGSWANTEDGDVARQWLAYWRNSSAQTLDFKVFALCSRSSDATIETTRRDDVASRTAAPVATTCPSGSRVVGGGLGTTGPMPTGSQGNTYVLQMSGPVDETATFISTEDGDVAPSWWTYALNQWLDPVAYKAFALCSRQSDATIEATAFELPTSLSFPGAAVCPAGKRVLGGGIGSHGPAPGGTNLNYIVQAAAPEDETDSTRNTVDGDIARRFYAYVDNRSGATQTFKVLALCATDDTPRGSDGGGGGPGGGGPGGDGRGGGGGPLCGGKVATIVGTNRSERITGTRRADVVVALGGNDRIKGGRGNDVICAGAGNDTVSGGDGSDRVAGGAGNDRLAGGKGNDRLSGQNGRDTLLGHGGRDTLSGGAGRDSQQQ